ncbi:MAG: 3-hydroxyacyl-CoA dehydrogenase NAD-binding domain-containing protein [Bacteroidota bacterium]|nr:3-hydroxyacyl-CoA dehydrogenase NAD-binding domain-containing protein [Bacteroidota bacterium]
MALSIGIVGAGTMGAGIAHVAALHKINVSLYDINEEVIRRSVERINFEMKRGVDKSKISEEDMKQAMNRIKKRTNINDLDTCDIIIEAVLEDIRVKKDLFKKLDQVAHHTTILATNTSSLSVTSIASATKKPERVIGMHFFNPVHLMKLVEVVKGTLTSDETVKRTTEIAHQIGKKTVQTKDTPGFIVNRVARPFYGEALKLLSEGVASVQEIDHIVKNSGGFKMGPFELMDLIGNDVNLSVTESVYEQMYHDPRFRPSPLQKQMVEAGLFGKKSKKGFYNYEEL